MKLPLIKNPRELAELIREIGFLPLFRCGIEGFSLEECTPPGYWFVKDVEGPWEWRERIAEEGEIAYAKLFHKKAGFISREWYPDFANYRRDGYDFDARYDDGLASMASKMIMDVLLEHTEGLLSSELKVKAGFIKEAAKGFDTALTTLQMQTYVTASRFEYKQDKSGRPYGWGVGRYAVSENVFGTEWVTSRYSEQPAESKARIAEHAAKLFPAAGMKLIEKVIK
ncbi:hypothetical protein [Paenibacillus sp. MMS20-IR301]|uniref:AlkZ-related protein n=1 Tax=Paenibacillus sp. MMS20-IR301 TaxID=2895946 RepID=UPI0028E2A8E7|nr:hypothetical protein [Paenibacillus sp. MMS20-IR301]WNS46129.1 hypothetical protein LOS79_12925 [Paenibacillus sp. MMS20-IR301]